MDNCIFCKIIEQEIPSYKIYEDEAVYAFLDISQVTPGHTLIVPKKHVTDIFSYDEELASQVFARVPKIARALEAAFPDMQGEEQAVKPMSDDLGESTAPQPPAGGRHREANHPNSETNSETETA